MLNYSDWLTLLTSETLDHEVTNGFNLIHLLMMLFLHNLNVLLIICDLILYRVK